MNKLILLNHLRLKKILNKRSYESKFGEHIHLLTTISNIYEQIKNLDVDFVIFGIPEDIGVFANYGNLGARNAWEATLNVLLNIQSNKFTKANRVLVLGHLDFTEELNQLNSLKQTNTKDIKIARNLVSQIDTHVTQLVHDIVKAGKKPIIIGGGHNNAYGNIKGTSLALAKPIHAINFDAHTDFRREEGRHSGNGFSYAYSEGFLKNYFVFGLHKNYTSDSIFKQFESTKSLDYTTYEDLEITKQVSFKSELKRALNHVAIKPFGIEIDCDAIGNIPSSAQTPSGFNLRKTRQFMSFFAKQNNASYLHICEASPKKKQQKQVGKLITYLITDFITNHGN